MWNELKRKIFHLGSLIYVVGLVYMPRSSYMALLAGLTAIVFFTETARLRIPAIGSFACRIFGPLMRDKERTQYSGVFWMLLGVTITVVLVPDVPVAGTALLYLILGDAMASLIGLRLQGPFWPRGQKRVSGSAACFLTCLLIGVVLLRPERGWNGVFFGALTATVIEFGLVRLDDNVTIPVASALVLMLCYGLTPGF